MRTLIKSMIFAATALTLYHCNSIEIIAPESTQNTIDIIQMSSQLASGSSFHVFGSSTYDANLKFGEAKFTSGRKGGPKHGRHNGLLDGLSLLAPTEELLTIVEAESAGDMRGMRIAQKGGAVISNLDKNGNPVTLPTTEPGPHGSSFSGKQFPKIDSLLSLIATTIIDYGNGVTFQRDTVTITRSGKITINRSEIDGVKKEVVTFDNYIVNGNKIEGTKTRTASFDKITGKGNVGSRVINGKITFSGGEIGIWESNRSRISEITFSSSGDRPIGGTVTTEVDSKVTLTDGTRIYAHQSTEPLIEKINCGNKKKAPTSGIIQTTYRDQNLIIDFGNGSCDKMSIVITLNGEVVERPIRH